MYTVVEDVMANDYVAGEGVNFFDKASFRERWDQQEIGRKEMSESLIAFSVDMTEDEITALPDALDLLGDFPEAQQGSIAENTKMFRGVEVLERELGLSALRPMRNAEGNLFLYRPSSPVVRRIFQKVFEKMHEIERDQFVLPWAMHDEPGVTVSRALPLMLNATKVGHLKRHGAEN